MKTGWTEECVIQQMQHWSNQMKWRISSHSLQNAGGVTFTTLKNLAELVDLVHFQTHFCLQNNVNSAEPVNEASHLSKQTGSLVSYRSSVLLLVIYC